MRRPRAKFDGATLKMQVILHSSASIRLPSLHQAMKRLGFEVVQTAGSSVRFDPPASTARPITFHRVRTLSDI